MSDLSMFDLVKWAGWMICTTFCLLVLRALFRKPASAPSRHWRYLSTPELLQCAFTTKQMYQIAERTARNHLQRYGVGEWISFYTALFEEYASDPTTDGYTITGSITDLGDHQVRIIFNLTRHGETTEHDYTVSDVHLARITDVLSPTLLSRLDWHKKTVNRVSEG